MRAALRQIADAVVRYESVDGDGIVLGGVVVGHGGIALS